MRPLPSLVVTFSDQLLAHDLPDLDHERRREVVAFVARRVGGLPSPIRAGVAVIAPVLHGLGLAAGPGRVAAFVGRRPVPLVGEYARLVRSLAYAYVWETWPDTTATGARP